uniref:uncharacterized protein si:ch73-303b9.1 n=1 Tax=Doryrhamphus excisus TaxID=161450 RepID=UPI0025ADCFDD|nr:uncharacterized protein si:ch73-303b9.1 [Doryrhamphus excisus]
MEKVYPLKDMSSFECFSPSELDRKFFGEQSLPSLDQLSISANGSDFKPPILASLCVPSDLASPTQASSLSDLNTQDAENCHLRVPLQGKSSTPYILLQKQKAVARIDQSYNDLTTSQMSWDVSLIKSENNSPKLFMDSSALETVWSPKPQCQLQHRPDVSP